MLRRVGAAVFDQPGSHGVVGARRAADWGFVHELHSDTRSRFEALFHELASSSTQVAPLKWLLRRWSQTRAQPPVVRFKRERPETWTGEQPLKRVARSTTSEQRCGAIVAALCSSDTLVPRCTRELLDKFVSEALLTSKELRHDFHQRAASLLREALSRVEKELVGRVAAFEALVLSAEGEGALRDANLVSSEAQLMKCQQALLEAKESLERCSSLANCHVVSRRRAGGIERRTS